MIVIYVFALLGFFGAMWFILTHRCDKPESTNDCHQCHKCCHIENEDEENEF